MGILDNYRKQRPSVTRVYLRVAILTALFVVVVTIMIVLRRRAREAEGLSRIPARPAPASALPAAGSGSMPASPPAGLPEWKPLSPAEERNLLAKITDQAPLAVREHREAYYYLLNKVHRMTDAEINAQLDLTVGYEEFANQADIVRGSVVEVKGHLLRLEETPLDPSRAGLPVVYEGQIMDRSLKVYSFRLTESPRPAFEPGQLRIEDARHVRLRGIFMQVVVYQNREVPPTDVAAPLIIGRKLVEIPPVGRKTSWLWLLVLALLATVIAVRLGIVLLPKRGPRHRRHIA